LFLSYTDDLSG